MVRPAIAFAVVALGAAAVLAQSAEFDELETREFDSDDVIVAREVLEAADLASREEIFAELNARDVEEVMEYLRAVAEAAPPPAQPTPPPMPTTPPTSASASGSGAAPAPAVAAAAAGAPTVTLTSTLNPAPTACTAKDLKEAKREKKVLAATKTLKQLNEKQKSGKLTAKEKAARKKAQKVLKRARARNLKKAKKMVKKCRSALRKAGLNAKTGCVADKKDVCETALTKAKLTEEDCVAAKLYVDVSKKLKAARKAAKKSKGSKEATEKVKSLHRQLSNAKVAAKSKSKSVKAAAKEGANALVGPDGTATVVLYTVGPTCTKDGAAPTATPTPTETGAKKAKREMEEIFSREYDFEELD